TGKSVSAIAREIDMARPSLSMLLNNTYPAQSLDLVTRKHAAKVVKLYRDQVLCPHLKRGISTDECQAHAFAPMSTSNPEKLQQWQACRCCPLNPKGDQS
ncbi:MarR family transcriptional regulator, partial [Hoeflea sp.]|uniref:MarR family transcriptional regulator n=1 Tax=Hoeflea sp. TaxID=1940281 RepID=UPI002AFE7CC2